MAQVAIRERGRSFGPMRTGSLSDMSPETPARLRTRLAAFTLLEVCLAVAIAVLLLTLALPSVSNLLAEQQGKRSFDAFNGLVHQAQQLSITERRTYLIAWVKEGLLLRPEKPANDGEAKGVAHIELAKGESYDIDLTAALVKDPPMEWAFWPTGTCEPATLTYQNGSTSWTARYDPLTARATILSNESK